MNWGLTIEFDQVGCAQSFNDWDELISEISGLNWNDVREIKIENLDKFEKEYGDLYDTE